MVWHAYLLVNLEFKLPILKSPKFLGSSSKLTVCSPIFEHIYILDNLIFNIYFLLVMT